MDELSQQTITGDKNCVRCIWQPNHPNTSYVWRSRLEWKEKSCSTYSYTTITRWNFNGVYANLFNKLYGRAMFVTSISPRRPWFAPGSVHIEFVVYNFALGQVFLRVLPFSLVSIIPPWLFILAYHLGDEQLGLLVAAVQRHSLTLSTWTTMNVIGSYVKFNTTFAA
jgi:hypothetical protein